MPRSSRVDTARHHEELIEAASRLFRERGLESVSVPDVMGEVGLTRGGFYKHFESKEALVATAIDAAYDAQLETLGRFAAEHPDDPAAARTAFLDFYLSPEHRDDPGGGCPTVLANAIAQCDAGSAPREAFTAGVRKILTAYGAGEIGADPDERQTEILGEMATLVGALMMARATVGDPMSDAILTAARRRLG
ncbi:MAG TPA: TetR/AcrR family transcriptional regulator [Pseudonocardia sp.]|nr:TetR/AcrR family transcriptional regulator [Pseudonocardia sp.]